MDDLHALQKALTAWNVGEGTSLASSVGMKILREGLRDDLDDPLRLRPSSSTPDSQTPSLDIPQSSRVQLLSPPLLTSLYGGFNPLPRSPNMGLAHYNGQLRFVERKAISQDISTELAAIIRARAENLAALLHASKDPSFRTLHCLGMLEEVQRYAFVFQHPVGKGEPKSLLDFLSIGAKYSPGVTERMRLTLIIAKAIHQMHMAGWLHKNLRSENILFFPPPDAPTNWTSIAGPYLVGFSYARIDSPDEISERLSKDQDKDIYRHPSSLGEPSVKFDKLMDIYAFGATLVEIAEWQSLRSIFFNPKKPILHSPASTEEIARVRDHLLRRNIAFRMGNIYNEVTMDCLTGAFLNEREMEGEDRSAVLQQNFYNKVVRRLERCIV